MTNISDYNRMYYASNKDKIMIKRLTREDVIKEYYQNNKEKIIDYNKNNYYKNSKIKIQCFQCGAIVRKSSLKTHLKTKKHTDYTPEVKTTIPPPEFAIIHEKVILSI